MMQQRGKSQMLRLIADKMLDAGKTVTFVSLVDGRVVTETRGFATAKDVTPKRPIEIEAKP